MILTECQQHALQLFISGENILLLGNPGTGKSTLISAMVKHATSEGKKVAKTASTGIAAQLIGGRTIHSLLKAYPGMQMDAIDYASKTSNLEDISVLIIDEISMLGHSFIEYLYNCLLYVNHHIQLVLVGDFFQLPPVKDTYAFMSPYWKLLGLKACFLNEVIRQNDADFIINLNLLKYGNKSCLDYLRTHSNPTPLNGQISICATRSDAHFINQTELKKLEGPSQLFAAEYSGSIADSDLRVEKSLTVKKGMRVMCAKNGTGYSNGSLGTITNFDANGVAVRFDSGSISYFGKSCFTVERKDIPGETTDFWQIPLCPAYAITIHKSQGQTFDLINIDGRKCWAAGQLYVAVSRAKTIEGIHFLTPINAENIKTNPSVIKYIQSHINDPS